MRSKYLLLFFIFLAHVQLSLGQAPAISYSGGPQTFTTGVAITPLAPVNTGGAIPGTSYGLVSTLAGNGAAISVNGTGTAASFNNPQALAADPSGNIYVTEGNSNLIRKITPSGVATTFAGSAVGQFADGTGTGASFNHPAGIAADASGNIYVADYNNNRVRKITPSGVVTTLAGNGNYAHLDGTGTAASFQQPSAIAVDISGNVFVTDAWGIRKITAAGVVTTLPGGIPGGNLALDYAGNVYTSDYQHVIKTTSAGVTTTFEPTGFLGTYYSVGAIYADSSNGMYVPDLVNNLIKYISPSGVIQTVVGNGAKGATDGAATLANFWTPKAVTLDNKGNLYVADGQNNLIRKVLVTGYTISPALPPGLDFDETTGVISGAATTVTGTTTYTVTAYNAGGSGTATISISSVANTAPATITSFSPSAGTAGTLVTITGTNLVNTLHVQIGGSNAVIISNTNTQVVAMVMSGALTGSVTLNTAVNFASAPAGFTVLPAPLSFAQQGNKLLGTGSTGAAKQGNSVALSADGNTAIVGGNLDNSGVGAAWIFVRSNGTWVQQGNKLVGSDHTGASDQGVAVAISADGNTAVVGADADNSGQGAAWVFVRNGSSWVQQGGKLVGTGNVGAAGQGGAVAISGDGNTILSGGKKDSQGLGAVWAFTRTAKVWTQQAELPTNGLYTYTTGFGSAIALSANGNIAAISIAGDYNGNGGLWVFTRSGNTWARENAISVKDNIGTAQPGASLSISADGYVIAFGGPGDNGGQGAVWTYNRRLAIKAKLPAVTGNTGAAAAGTSVAVNADGSVILIGGAGDGGSAGALWTFVLSNGVYQQQGSKLVGTGNAGIATLGKSAAFSADGSTFMTCGFNDNNGQGAAWVFNALLPPAAYTLPAASVTSTGAVIKGTVNDNGNTTTVSLEYGTAADLSGSSLAVLGTGTSPLPAGAGMTSFTATLSGLNAGTQYYFRIVAANNYGTVQGTIQSFTTVGGTPVISSFSPLSGPAGTILHITGANLFNPDAVTIGGIPAVVISGTPTDLMAMVMPGAISGNVTVTMPAGSASASGGFTLTGTPLLNQQQGSYLGTATVSTNSSSNQTTVAISADGSTVAVGIPSDNNAQGGVWVYVKAANGWTLQAAKLMAAGNGTYQGSSVAISADGNTLIFGGSSSQGGTSAWVFTRTGSAWSQQGARLVSASSSAVVNAGWTRVGLSADGNTAMLSSFALNTVPMATIFVRNGNSWIQQGGDLTGIDYSLTWNGFTGNPTDPTSALAISADGNTAVIGANEDNNYNGAIWIFKRTNGLWTLQSRKLFDAGATQQSFEGLGTSVAVSADGNTVIAGAPSPQTGQNDVGAAVFVRNGATWTQQGPMLFGTGVLFSSASQGSSVALSADGNTAIVGGSEDNFHKGALWVYRRSNGTWVQQSKLVASGWGPNPTYLGSTTSFTPDGTTLFSGGYTTVPYAIAPVWAYAAGPVVTTLPATAITLSGGTLNGTVDGNQNVTSVSFEYGTAASLAGAISVPVSTGISPIQPGTGLQTFSSLLTGLAANTVYYYRINAATNNGIYQGFIQNFKTTQAPLISSITPATGISGTTVTINGSNLNGATAVAFAGVAATSFAVVSPTVITAVVGSGASGSVSVTTPLGSTQFSGFSYVPVPAISPAGIANILPGNSGVILSASPGTGGYTYQWFQNGVSISGATGASYSATQIGSYTVSISLNGVSQVSPPTVVTTVFALPANNFRIAATSATCKGSANGAITISAVQNFSYTATITGGSVNAGYPFTTNTTIPNLAAGTYNVCITVAGQSTYQQCFSVVITEPKDLSVYAASVTPGNQLVLTLNGGTTYHINLNGSSMTTSASSVTLSLAKGTNTILVSTDKACQGVIEKDITVSDEALAYPNPFDHTLNLALGKGTVKQADILVFGSDGRQVYHHSFTNVSGAVQLDLPALKAGLYVLKLSADGVDTVFKIVKK